MLFKIGSIAALVGSVAAHMATIEPCPRFNPNCAPAPALPADCSYDYNYIKSPIAPDSDVLCKSNTPWPQPVAQWTAGQTVTVKFQPDGAAHGGGHCQFSLSYDGGKTFVVVHEELQYCFFGQPSSSNTPAILEYNFQLPADVPSSDNVIFAWTWVNAVGNREFYMNCADITVSGGTSTTFTGKQMLIANHNGYETIPEFNGDYTTGLSLYQNSPNITVSGGGYAAVPPSDTGAVSSSEPAYSTEEPVYTTEEPSYVASEVPAYSSSEVPAYSSVEIPTYVAPEVPAYSSDAGSPVGHTAVEDASISSAPVYSAPTVPTEEASTAPEYSAVPAPSEEASTTPEYTAAPVPTEEPYTKSACSAAPAPTEEADSSLPVYGAVPVDSATVSASDGCSHGAMECTSGGGFKVCVWGTWTNEMACSSGTVCQQTSDTAITCGWPTTSS
ncbi:hypothetical protein H4R20_002600 [Coemansia guatemalensis]|uniref:Chitin-binding type-4 domain-containing protein n=1 Tax=Coemansia guatemalensis TaxID=2761395 RepID=A0A9W8LS56_9FUNG|nr:hypothetical protein H4R20_002600 [Coemansia guatemalensis]